MFIAHLPAGYVVTSWWLRHYLCGFSDATQKNLFWCGLLASIFPDVDLLYFYFIDRRQHLHHSYWINIPYYWTLILGTLLIAGIFAKRRIIIVTNGIIMMNIVLHLLLDTIAGKIRWLYPFSRADIVLFHIPARYSWWVMNFIFHWTFLLEIVIIILTIFFLRNNRDVCKGTDPG